MNTNTIVLFLWIGIGIAMSFAFVYLALNFFKKQDFIVAKFSQRLMSFLLDMFSLNVITFAVGMIILAQMGNVKEIVTNYVLLVQEQGGGRFWYDLRYIQMILILIHGVYSAIAESLKWKGTLGRVRSDLNVITEEGTPLSPLNSILRNLLKTTTIALSLLFFGLKGLIVLMIIYYAIYRLSSSGKLLHDYLAKSKVIIVEEELKEIKEVSIIS